jgi:hypothetical protein
MACRATAFSTAYFLERPGDCAATTLDQVMEAGAAITALHEAIVAARALSDSPVAHCAIPSPMSMPTALVAL